MKLLGSKVQRVVYSKCRIYVLRRLIMIFALPITFSLSQFAYSQNEQNLESDSVTSDATTPTKWSIGDEAVEDDLTTESIEAVDAAEVVENVGSVEVVEVVENVQVVENVEAVEAAEVVENIEAVEDAELDENIDTVELAEISDIPIVDLPPELSTNLDSQFQNVLRLEEELDAFDERLGESYFGYAATLAKAGRLEEARDMYAKVLHLSKINNGVYSLEQRPILRAMFELHSVEGDVDAMEAAVNQIIWLERKNPQVRDRYSYDLVTKLAGAYIDLYYTRPRFDDVSLLRVQKAIQYLNYSVRRYEVQLNEEKQPFGDLANLHFINSKINEEIGRSSFYDPRRDDGRESFRDRPRLRPNTGSFGIALGTLERYLIRAKFEKNIVHEVQALRDLGDLNLLFDRPKSAAYFYRLSWEAATNLDENHELVKAFEQPVRVPDYDYSSSTLYTNSDSRHAYLPVNLDLESSGRVEKVYRVSGEEIDAKIGSRVRRSARKYVFRPVIENGEMIASNGIDYKVKIRLREDDDLVELGLEQ